MGPSMETARRHQLYTIYEANEVDSSRENAHTNQFSATRGRRYGFLNANGDFIPGATSGNSSTTFEPPSSVISPSSIINRAIDDDGDFLALLFQQFTSLALANTHLSSPQDSGYDWDDESGFSEPEEDEDDFFMDIDWDGATLEIFADMSELRSPTPDEYEASSTEFQMPNSRIHRDRRWELHYPRQIRPLLQSEALRNEEITVQNYGGYGGNSEDYAMIDGEDEDEDELLLDSCFDLIDYLDYLMLPTVQVLEFFHRELEGEDGDSDLEDASDWSILEWE